MKMILNEWPRDPKGGPSGKVKLGNYLNSLFGFQGGPYEVPPFITYRDAHQIFEKVSMEGDNGRRAIEAVRLLIGGTGTEAVTLEGAGAPEPLVEYQWVGNWSHSFVKVTSKKLRHHLALKLAHGQILFFGKVGSLNRGIYRKPSTTKVIAFEQCWP